MASNQSKPDNIARYFDGDHEKQQSNQDELAKGQILEEPTYESQKDCDDPILRDQCFDRRTGKTRQSMCQRISFISKGKKGHINKDLPRRIRQWFQQCPQIWSKILHHPKIQQQFPAKSKEKRVNHKLVDCILHNKILDQDEWTELFNVNMAEKIQNSKRIGQSRRYIKKFAFDTDTLILIEKLIQFLLFEGFERNLQNALKTNSGLKGRYVDKMTHWTLAQLDGKLSLWKDSIHTKNFKELVKLVQPKRKRRLGMWRPKQLI